LVQSIARHHVFKFVDVIQYNQHNNVTLIMTYLAT